MIGADHFEGKTMQTKLAGGLGKAAARNESELKKAKPWKPPEELTETVTTYWKYICKLAWERQLRYGERYFSFDDTLQEILYYLIRRWPDLSKHDPRKAITIAAYEATSLMFKALFRTRMRRIEVTLGHIHANIMARKVTNQRFPNPADEAARRDEIEYARRKIAEGMENITGRKASSKKAKRELVGMIYGDDGMTQTEAAAALNIAPKVVADHHEDVLRTLRQSFGVPEVKTPKMDFRLFRRGIGTVNTKKRYWSEQQWGPPEPSALKDDGTGPGILAK